MMKPVTPIEDIIYQLTSVSPPPLPFPLYAPARVCNMINEKVNVG